MFSSHDNCSAEWCFKAIAPEERKTYNEIDDRFRCKQNDNQLYNLLKKTPFLFHTYNVLKELLHMFDTHKKESMNNVIASCYTPSSGRRYDSSSGHDFIIGGRSKGVI